MVFYCQRNGFEKEYRSKVVSCIKSKLLQLPDGTFCLSGDKAISKKSKPKEVECYEVTFEDTVFFPEGGGQPDDQGTVTLTASDVTGNVLRVIRRGGDAIHFVDIDFPVGDSVVQKIDWQRRKDHMQQHSAQHLITAVADNKFGFPTTSWSLGVMESTIELGTKLLSEEEVRSIEEEVNEAIANALPVTVTEFEPHDPALLKRVRSRGLPADATGRVRVVSITGLDNNMCCGTHVSNTSQLQAVKILKKEAGKQGNMNITFVAGDRLLRHLSDMSEREASLNVLLHCNPREFEGMVSKLQRNLKLSEKCSKEAMKELALAEGELFSKKSPETPKHRLWSMHKSFGDMEFCSTLAKQCTDPLVVKVFTTGPDAGPGCLYLGGPAELINKFSKQVCDLLDGRGGGKSVFTAKVNNLSESKRKEVYCLIEKAIEEHDASII